MSQGVIASADGEDAGVETTLDTESGKDPVLKPLLFFVTLVYRTRQKQSKGEEGSLQI